MKPLLTILLLSVVLLVLAALAVAVLFSMGSGRASWILSGVLILDSAALLIIGACIFLRGNRRGCALGGGAGGRGGEPLPPANERDPLHRPA